MESLKHRIKNLFFLLATSLLMFSCSETTITIDDSNGIFSKTNSPVSVKLKLNEKQINAAKEGLLGLVELSEKKETVIPVQIENNDNGTDSKITFIMPDGNPGNRKFKLVTKKSKPFEEIKATVDSKSGQIVIDENNKKVLQYNYQTVYEKDVIRNKLTEHKSSEYSPVGGIYLEKYYKSHPGIKKDTVVTTQIYAVPRSDYIHPLYGLNGEMLTRDWPDTGHPHHRGIFWAWPEVMYGSGLGDLYALQRVFARPTGNIKYTGGAVFAEINAENLWMWEDSEPIVNEHAIIRIYKSTPNRRVIDLTIKLLALKDSITIATRLTNSYGGLNLRLQSPGKQVISYFTDEVSSKPLRAWSDFSGVFKGNKSTSGLMVLQHRNNPEYPGIWRDYPGLAWVQPTFPTPETRYLLDKETPLILRFRLIIHEGEKLDKKISEENWDAYNRYETPMIKIGE